MTGVMQRVQHLGEQIVKELLDPAIPNVDKCRDLLNELNKECRNSMNLEILEKTKIGKLLTKSIKSLKRHKRTATPDEAKEWESAIEEASKLLERWKGVVQRQAQQNENSLKTPTNSTTAIFSNEPRMPSNVAEYRMRLVVQKKELYKDPPVMPPLSVEIDRITYPSPQRDGRTGLLTFTANDSDVKQILKQFQPNRTPEEVLRAGSFGGTYFRTITSAVTNITYNAQDVLKDTVDETWIRGLPMNMLTSKTYRPQINRYGVKCGGSLGKLLFAHRLDHGNSWKNLSLSLKRRYVGIEWMDCGIGSIWMVSMVLQIFSGKKVLRRRSTDHSVRLSRRFSITAPFRLLIMSLLV